MRRISLISVFVLSLSSLVLPADTPKSPAQFFWPLKREIQISSGFGDGRPGRFHMGLDLRTGGRVGLPVYAPEDGYVRRISTSYSGYGKGLYISGLSGRTYVYGHLDGFNKKIGSVVERKQLESLRYYQDIQPDSKTLPVKKGQLLAYTGQTGAGAPHLHFEIRDPENRPVNPLLFKGLRLKDTTPPKFEALWLVYRDDASLFTGGGREIKLKPVMSKTGRMYVADTILVTGRFAIEAAIEDVAAPGSFMIGPERMALTIDGRLYHQVEYDRLDYAQNRLSLLDRDPDPAKSNYDRVYALYRKPGNELSNYRADVPGDGSFADTVDGFHTIAIEAADAFGNTRRLEFTVFYAPVGQILENPAAAIVSDSLIVLPLVPAADRAAFETMKLFGSINGGKDTLLGIEEDITDDSLTLKGNFGRFRQFRLVFNRRGMSYPSYYFSRLDNTPVPAAENAIVDNKIIDDGLLCTVEVPQSGINWLTGIIITDRGEDTIAYRRVARNRFARHYRPADSVGFIDRIIIEGPPPWLPDTVVLGMHHLIAGLPERLDFNDNLTVDCGANDLFGKALLAIIDTTLPPPASGGFVRQPFALLPDWLAFANPMGLTVRFPILPDTTKTAFYIHRSENRWSWVGRRVDMENNRLTATVSGGGAYAVLTDTLPPTITELNIQDKQTISSGRPQIRCVVADELSGLEDDRNFEITIDGKWVIPEYDFDQKLLTAKPHWTIRGTSHILKITVRDRCGNATTVSRTFHVMAKTGP